MTFVRWMIFAVSFSLALAHHAGAATPNVRVTPQATQPEPTALQIGRGDQVRFEVFGDAGLATTTSVAEDGSVRLPLIGLVNVSGLSIGEAARKVEAAYKVGQFLVDPQVTVSVVQAYSQLVTIYGEVSAPGRYPIKFDSTLLDVIALAGGITEKGSDVVYVLRDDKSGVTQRMPVNLGRMLNSRALDTAAIKFQLQAGDSVLVPKGTFTITGQVASPGEYRIEGDMILFEGIERAGGITPLGSDRRIEIRRRGPDDKIFEVKKVNKNMRIEAGDMITVKERIF